MFEDDVKIAVSKDLVYSVMLDAIEYIHHDDENSRVEIFFNITNHLESAMNDITVLNHGDIWVCTIRYIRRVIMNIFESTHIWHTLSNEEQKQCAMSVRGSLHYLGRDTRRKEEAKKDEGENMNHSERMLTVTPKHVTQAVLEVLAAKGLKDTALYLMVSRHLPKMLKQTMFPLGEMMSKRTVYIDADVLVRHIYSQLERFPEYCILPDELKMSIRCRISTFYKKAVERAKKKEEKKINALLKKEKQSWSRIDPLVEVKRAFDGVSSITQARFDDNIDALVKSRFIIINTPDRNVAKSAVEKLKTTYGFVVGNQLRHLYYKCGVINVPNQYCTIGICSPYNTDDTSFLKYLSGRMDLTFNLFPNYMILDECDKGPDDQYTIVDTKDNVYGAANTANGISLRPYNMKLYDYIFLQVGSMVMYNYVLMSREMRRE